MFAPYSILEDCQIEFVQSRGIGNDVDFDDFPAPDLEAEHPRQSPAWSPHESHRSVNQHRLYGAGKLREAERPLGPSLRAPDLPRCSRAPSVFVHTDYDIWVEHCDKYFEVTRAQGREKSLNNASLLGEIRCSLSSASCTRRRARLAS